MSHIRIQHLESPPAHPCCASIEIWINGKRKNKVFEIRILPKSYESMRKMLDSGEIVEHEELVGEQKYRWIEFDADVEFESSNEFGLCSVILSNPKK